MNRLLLLLPAIQKAGVQRLAGNPHCVFATRGDLSNIGV